MDKERMGDWFWAGAALLAGLLLRLWFVARMPLIAGDGLVYGDIAKTWLQHGVYGLSADPTHASIAFRPTLCRLPGYPLFLAACFRLFGMENYRAALDVQVVADLATCWLASALAGRLFGRRARLSVLWIAALCPFTANYVATALAETLVFTTIALGFYAFARWQDAGLGYNRWLWVVAGSLAYSILLRPDEGLLAAAVLPAMLWSAQTGCGGGVRSWRSALPVLAASLCVALPLLVWTARNELVFHVFQPIAPRDANDPGEPTYPGFGRWYNSWAIDFTSVDKVCWPMDGERVEFSALPSRAFAAATPAASEELRRRTVALLADYNTTLILTPALDARFAALADERIHDHPILYYFGLPVARVLDMALRPRTELMPVADEWWRWREHRAQTVFAAAYATLNVAYFALAIVGLRAWRRRAWRSSRSAADNLPASNPPGLGQRSYGELAGAMAAYILMHAALLLFIGNAEPRYTLEFYPVFFVWIGALFADAAVVVPAKAPRAI